MPKPVADALAKLKVGEITKPVNIGGWHIYKLYGRRAASTLPFAQVADVIVKELTREQRAAALTKWVQRPAGPRQGGRSCSDDPRWADGCCYTQPTSAAASTPGVLVKDILIALLLIAVVILVFGAVNQDQRIDFNYIAGTWHGTSTFALAGIGAGVTLVAGLGVAAVARMHVLGGRRKLEREVEQVYVRLRAAEAASPAAAEASRAAVRTPARLGGGSGAGGRAAGPGLRRMRRAGCRRDR